MGRSGKRALLVLVSLVVALAAAEGLVRALVFLPITTMGTVMRSDPVLDHSLRPGSRGRMVSREFDVEYRINAWGLRDDLFGTREILILGDSFMEGYGVEQNETLAARLEAMGRPTINAGVKSYSPILEYIFLRHRGLAFNPDTVILFLDLSDPANDAFYSRRAVHDERGPVAIRPRRSRIPLPTGKIPEILEDRSALYQYGLHLALKHFPASDEDVGYAGAAAGIDLLFPGRDTISDSDYRRGEWTIVFDSILRIRDLLRENRIDFILATYPYGHQVSADAWSEGRKAWNFPPGVSSDRPFRFIEDWASRHGIEVISLDRAFRAHPDPGSLYFTHDGHWTAMGHEYAAKVVLEALEAMETDAADTAGMSASERFTDPGQ